MNVVKFVSGLFGQSLVIIVATGAFILPAADMSFLAGEIGSSGCDYDTEPGQYCDDVGTTECDSYEIVCKDNSAGTGAYSACTDNAGDPLDCTAPGCGDPTGGPYKHANRNRTGCTTK